MLQEAQLDRMDVGSGRNANNGVRPWTNGPHDSIVIPKLMNIDLQPDR